MLARRVVARPGEHLKDAVRGAGPHAFALAAQQSPKVQRMQPVNVFGWRKGVEYRQFVDLPGQRELGEDAVEAVVALQPCNHLQQLGLRGLGGQVERLGEDASVRAILRLDRNVADRCGIIADQYRRESRRHAPFAQSRNTHRNLRLDLRRDRLAINDLCRHGHSLVAHGERAPGTRSSARSAPVP